MSPVSLEFTALAIESHTVDSEVCVHVCVLSCFSSVQLFATPWAVAHQAPLCMGISRQEYWSGLPCPPPGNLNDPGLQPKSLMSPALAGGFFTTSVSWEAPSEVYLCHLPAM